MGGDEAAVCAAFGWDGVDALFAQMGGEVAAATERDWECVADGCDPCAALETGADAGEGGALGGIGGTEFGDRVFERGALVVAGVSDAGGEQCEPACGIGVAAVREPFSKWRSSIACDCGVCRCGALGDGGVFEEGAKQE